MRTNISRAILTVLGWLLFGHTAYAEELTLNQTIEIACKNNPSIAAGLLTSNASVYAAKGAKSLANPDFNIAPSVVGDAGSDSALLLTQPLEINGSRRVRGQIAAYQATAVAHDAITLTRDITLQVKQIYWDIVQSQQHVILQQQNIAYLEALDKAARKQVDVGTTPGSQVIKTEVELARAKQELAQAQLKLHNTKSAMNTLLNRPVSQDFTPIDALAFTNHSVDREKLITNALASRPEVLAASSQAVASELQIASAKLRLVPDVELQARKETFDDEGGSGIALNITLPVFDWGSAKAERLQARQTSRAKQKELQAVKNNVALDVEQAVQSLETTARIVQEYKAGILDKSSQLAAMAQKGYEKGATSYIEVLEAQRTLRNVNTEHLSALADNAKAVAQLEWAANIELQTVEASK